MPMLIGAALIAGMLIWSRGRTALMERYSSQYSSLEKARPLIRALAVLAGSRHVPFSWLRAPTTFRRSWCTTSSGAARCTKRSSCLPSRKMPTPEVPAESRYRLTALGDGFYKLVVSLRLHGGTTPSACAARRVEAEQIPFDPDDATYYIGHETIVASDAGSISRIPEAIFSYLNRNAVHEERRYGMPTDQIVEIGTQIDL